jgi:O-antigen ligase
MEETYLRERFLSPLYWFPLVIFLILFTWYILMRSRKAFAFLFLIAPFFWGFGIVYPLKISGFEIKPTFLIGGVVTFLSFIIILRGHLCSCFRKLKYTIWIFIIISSFSLFSVSNFINGLGDYLRVISPLIFMLAFLYQLKTMDDIILYLRSMFLSLISFVVILTIAIYEGMLYQTFGGLTRLGPLYIPAQQLSYYLTIMVAVGLLLYRYFNRQIYLLMVLLASIGTYLTGVRTSLIAIGLLFFVWAFVYKKWLLKVFILILGIFIINEADKLVMFILRYVPTIKSIGDMDIALSGRLSVNKVVWEHYSQSPLWNKLFGIGVGQSIDIAGRFGIDLYIHNDYLAIIIEMGIISAIVFGFFMFLILKLVFYGIRRGNRDSLAYLLILVVFAIMGFAGVWYRNIFAGWYLSGLIGIAIFNSVFLSKNQQKLV